MLAAAIGDDPETAAIRRPGAGAVVGQVVRIAKIVDLAGLGIQQPGQNLEIGASVSDQQVAAIG